MSIVNRMKAWQIGVLAAVLLAVIFGVYGVSTIFGGIDEYGSGAKIGNGVAEEQPVDREIPVAGRLVFTNSLELSFDAAGEVGDVLAVAGDWVEEGQILARLDAIAVASLGEVLAKAEFDLDAAQEALEEAKEDFVTTPLEQAEFEETIAKARKDVEDTEDKLADFQRDYQKDLAAARRAKVVAEVALDDAQEMVGYYDRDQAMSLATAQDDLSAKELALEKARERVANFENDFQEMIADARLKEAKAEEAFDVADDSLTAFLINPIRNAEEDERIDVEILRRRESTLKEAETNLQQAKDELADLPGNKQLEEQHRITALAQAESNVATARDTLAEVEDTVDQTLELQDRLSALEAAEAALAQTVRDLGEELDGPDQAELVVREKALKVAQEKLGDLVDGPDVLDVAVKEAAVAAAQAKVSDALQDLEGAVIHAPFSGVISLVNVEVDDKVNDESRVIEIVDLTELEIAGLVDAIDISDVREGDAATVIIASLPGQRFEGVVVQVAAEARTERGIVSYPVIIKVDVPEGIEIPARLSAVTTTITYQGGN